MRDDHFQALIRGLENRGISRTAIAEACHLSPVTVWRLAEGLILDPKYSTGRQLEIFSRDTIPDGVMRRIASVK
jgi:hypothetical protein